MALNIPIALLLLAPVVLLLLAAGNASAAEQQRQLARFRQLAVAFGMDLGDKLVLTEAGPAAIRFAPGAMAVKRDGKTETRAHLGMSFTVPAPGVSEEAGAAHAHRVDAHGRWHRPIREQMPSLPFEQPLAGGAWKLFTQDGEVPPCLHGDRALALLDDPTLRRLDVVPSVYLGGPEGTVRITLQYEEATTADAALRLLHSARTYLGQPTPSVTLPPRPHAWSGTFLIGFFVAFLGGMLLTFVTAAFEPTSTLWAQLLCPPGDSLKWVSSSGSGNSTNINVMCSADTSRLIFLPVWFGCGSIAGWGWVLLAAARRALTRASGSPAT